MVDDVVYIVRYVAEGSPIAENYASAPDALARIRKLLVHGVGYGYAIYADASLFMNQMAIFENLKIAAH